MLELIIIIVVIAFIAAIKSPAFKGDDGEKKVKSWLEMPAIVVPKTGAQDRGQVSHFPSKSKKLVI